MSIKVGQTGSASGVSGTKKSSKTGGSSGVDFASFLGGADEADSASSVASLSGVSGIEALLSVQNVGDATQGGAKRKRAIDYGASLLDELEDLRMGLLTGQISKAKLIKLAQILRTKKEEGLDPKLLEILEDIELRAEVELAKLQV